MERTNDTNKLQAQLMAYELILATLAANTSADVRRTTVAQLDVVVENLPSAIAPHLEHIFLDQIGRLRGALIEGIE